MKIQENSKAIGIQNRELVTLRERQKEHDERLAEAREQQAKVRADVSKRERKLRKLEKALEGKVSRTICRFLSHSLLD